MPRVSQNRLPLIDRFENHIISKDNCWLTDLSEDGCGYAKIRIGSKMEKAHRLSYELYKGKIPEGMCILHTCDNRLCVNPEHLELGTHQDNMNDRNLKNRQAKGEKHGRAKLIDEQVYEIKRLLHETNLTYKEIAKKFGVTKLVISQIKTGKSWKHVEYHAPVTKNITITNNITINVQDSRQLDFLEKLNLN